MYGTRSWDGPFHDIRQMPCAPNRPTSDQCSSNLPRSPFFAELVEPVGYLFFCTVIHQIGRRYAPGLIQAHIQRSI
jgi:hypothetical protein